MPFDPMVVKIFAIKQGGTSFIAIVYNIIMGLVLNLYN